MKSLTLRSDSWALAELLGLLNRHRQLIWEMAKREITDRYAGQILGTIWAVGHPLVLMLCLNPVGLAQGTIRIE